jgi:hypothetical protein
MEGIVGAVIAILQLPGLIIELTINVISVIAHLSSGRGRK